MHLGQKWVLREALVQAQGTLQISLEKGLLFHFSVEPSPRIYTTPSLPCGSFKPSFCTPAPRAGLSAYPKSRPDPSPTAFEVVLCWGFHSCQPSSQTGPQRGTDAATSATPVRSSSFPQSQGGQDAGLPPTLQHCHPRPCQSAEGTWRAKGIQTTPSHTLT